MNGRFAIEKLDITTHLFNFFNQILRRVFLEQKHFICPSLKVRILVTKLKWKSNRNYDQVHAL